MLHALEQLGGFRAPPAPPFAGGENETPSELLERVWALLSPTPVHVDELARQVSAPAGAVFAALVELSLAGRAELTGGAMAARG